MFFYTSDLHFNHAKILKYCNRPFESVEQMNRVLVENWNSRVRPDDTVFILGDFGFFNGETANTYLRKLMGKKVLVVGNHDMFLRKEGFNPRLFEDIAAIRNIKDPYYDNRKIVLCHYPIAVWDTCNYGTLHFYGHVHNNTAVNHPLLYELKNAYNVGVDLHGFCPVTAREVVESGAK